MSRYKALFLDLDGTVREPISDSKFIDDPDDQRLIKGVEEAIKYFVDREYIIFGLTNQAGVRYGYKTLENCVLEQFKTLELIPSMRQILFCPDLGESLGSVSKSSSMPPGIRQPSAGESAPLILVKAENFIVSAQTLSNISGSASFDSFRKPGIGMIQYLLFTFEIDRENSLMVGDMQSDRDLVKDIPCGFLWANQWREMFG